MKTDGRFFLVCLNKVSNKSNHTAVSIGNKMFMIGGSSNYFEVLNNFEVFDSVTRKFTAIKSVPKWIKYVDRNQIVCVGYNIYFFSREENNKVKAYSYDVKKNLFSFKALLNFESNKSFSCTKVLIY